MENWKRETLGDPGIGGNEGRPEYCKTNANETLEILSIKLASKDVKSTPFIRK